MSSLQVVLPGLLWPNLADAEYLAPQLTTPYFNKLFAVAKKSCLAFRYSDYYYAAQLNATQYLSDDSLARFYARQNNLQGYSGYLLIEPTHLRIDRDRLLICESELLQLNEDEARLLIEEINLHFGGEINLSYIREDLWLIGLNYEVNDLVSLPILDIIGENIYDHLPQGKNQLHIHKLLNEIQMLLFNLALNQQREQDGLLSVNSIWLWDKSLARLPKIGRNVLSNNAQLGNTIEHLEEQLKNCDTLLIDRAYAASRYRDSFAWKDILAQLDREVGFLLLQKLKSREFTHLELILPGLRNSLCFKLTAWDLLKFWSNSQFEFFEAE